MKDPKIFMECAKENHWIYLQNYLNNTVAKKACSSWLMHAMIDQEYEVSDFSFITKMETSLSTYNSAENMLSKTGDMYRMGCR